VKPNWRYRRLKRRRTGHEHATRRHHSKTVVVAQ
jgi:hypothetical protein